MQKARGIIHCHSNLSHDGKNSLEELIHEIKGNGFQFVALTEHSQGINYRTYRNYVKKCKRLCGDDFIVIPGLEILCPDGTEIAGIGLSKLIRQGLPENVFKDIKEEGGFAIWVHPRKRYRLPKRPCDSHAVEFINCKEDGTIAPNMEVFFKILQWKKKYNFHLIAGMDLHQIGSPLNVWIECTVSRLTEEEIVRNLIAGNYRNYVSRILINSSGKIKFNQLFKLIILRATYRTWNYALENAPNNISKQLISLSRNVVRKIKK